MEIKEKTKAHLSKLNEQLVERATNRNTQIIRLAGDVFFIGPVCIYAGARKSDLPMPLRIALIGIGAATIFYNLKNFIQVEKIINEIKMQENVK